jgi:Ca2+/Na+ antiporter
MILFSILLITISCIVIWRASDGFEVASEYLGRNLTEGVRGATINAIGSSIPELLTTLFFLFILKSSDGFAGGIGTTAGSAIFNGMIIPAAVILVVIIKRISSSVTVSRKVLLRDGISLLICEFVLIILIGGNSLTWIHGAILVAMYAMYAVYMIKSMKPSEAYSEEDQFDNGEVRLDSVDRGFIYNMITLNLEGIFIRSELHTKNSWILLSASIVVISSACFTLVKACELLGESIGIPIYFIAVVLASAATSVPDTILSIKDAKKGNYDDAVSNALGSNIFDICFALGFPLFMYTLIYGPITMSPDTVQNTSELRILLFIFTIFAFFIYIIPKKLGAISAFLLLLLYATFTFYVLGKSIDAEFTNEISSLLTSIDGFFAKIRFWN